MKKVLIKILFLLPGVTGLWSCAEEGAPVISAPPTARLLVGQMSPTVDPAKNVEIYTADVLWGGNNRKANLGFAASGVTNPGAGNAFIKSRLADVETALLQGQVELQGYQNYSAFLVNQEVANTTMNTAPVGMVVLKDDLTAATTGNAKVRFLHFGVGLPAIDLYFSVADQPASYAAGLQYARSFPGNVSLPVSAGAISAPVEAGFNSLPVGKYNYIIRAAGSDVDLIKGNITVAEGRVYTIVVRGFQTSPANVTGRALGITTITHERLAF